MIISMKDVSLVRQGKALLSHIDWEVQDGQTWAILGLNGAGKSTLLRLIMAEYWKTDGDVEVLGTHFGSDDISDLRKKIGVVGSFIAERFPNQLLAEEIVLTGKYKSTILYTAYDEEAYQQACELLINLGAKHLIGRPYKTLSQGERQTLLIARSLMDQPKLLILDEATSGLDLFAREKLLQQVEQIKQFDPAPTVLYVTHHIEEITSTMTHVLLLKEGQIAAQGAKQDILTPEVLSDFYGSSVSLIDIGDGRYFIKTEVGHV